MPIPMKSSLHSSSHSVSRPMPPVDYKRSACVGTPQPIPIVLPNNHPVVRFDVKNMFQAEQGFEVVAEAGDGDSAITQVLEHEPDVLLLDLAMPKLPGLEAMRAIMSRSPRVKI